MGGSISVLLRIARESGQQLRQFAKMSSFFTIPGAQNKRKRAPTTENPKKRPYGSSAKGPGKVTKPAAPSKRPERDDESISGSSDSEDGGFDEPEDEGEGSDSENEGETAAERRLRLATRYLENVKEQVQEVGFNAEDVDREILLERRLREDVAEAKGKVYRTIAGELAPEKASHTLFRGNTLATTSVATCAPFAYTVHKDRTLVKWRLQDLPANQFPQTTKKKPKKQAPPRRQPDKVLSRQGDRTKAAKHKNYQGHTGEILCVAASEDGQYVVTGGSDRRLIIHDAKTLKPLRVFTHHRDAVTGLAFRRGTNQLYTASKDRTVKVWSLEDGPPFAYVVSETCSAIHRTRVQSTNTWILRKRYMDTQTKSWTSQPYPRKDVLPSAPATAQRDCGRS